MLIDVTMPQLGESVSEGTITKWLVREGDTVNQDQPLVEVATDKADSELPAPAAGRVAKIWCAKGRSLRSRRCSARSKRVPPDRRQPPPAKQAPERPRGDGPELDRVRSATGEALATPTARKAALENDVNLANVRGSGDRGRITRDDVMRASAAVVAPPQPSRSSRGFACSPPPPPAEALPLAGPAAQGRTGGKVSRR